MEFLKAIAEPVTVGVTIAVCLGVPRIWVQVLMNKRDIERTSKNVDEIFDRCDTMSTDLSYIRGVIDK